MKLFSAVFIMIVLGISLFLNQYEHMWRPYKNGDISKLTFILTAVVSIFVFLLMGGYAIYLLNS